MLRALKNKIIRNVAKVYDPLVDVTIGRFMLKLPLSHQLKAHMEAYPDYNFNLPRLVKYASARYPDLTVIDIGANVGDTAAFIRNYSEVPILCIDGASEYIPLLKQNTAQFSNVSVQYAMISDENKDMQGSFSIERGTAMVNKGNETIKFRKLSSLLEDFPAFKTSRFVKTDTDGFDTIILRSCEELLRRNNPILFFEFDPYLISKNGDDAYSFLQFLIGKDYQHFIFYTNTGDFLASCDAKDARMLQQLVHYFSGRNMLSYADVCAFTVADKDLYLESCEKEILYFKDRRGY